MKNVMTINNLLEIAQRLPIQDQEECVHILSKRIIEEKRKKLLDEVHKAELEYSSGKAKQATAAEITETLVKIRMELPSGSERMKYRGSLEVCENPLCRCMGLTLHLTLDKELSDTGESATIAVSFDLRDKLNSSSTFELPMETFRRETGKVGRNDPCSSLAIKLPCS